MVALEAAPGPPSAQCYEKDTAGSHDHPCTLTALAVWVIVVGLFVILAVAGLPVFQRLPEGRLRLTEEMNNDIIFFASTIGVFTASRLV